MVTKKQIKHNNMKKTLIALAALATLAISCNKAEIISAPEAEEIAFDKAFVENVTKATDPSYSGTADFTSFNVWGTVNGVEGTVAIFANDQVSGVVGANNEWTCTKKQYWVKDAKYNFAALANAGTVTLGTDLLPKTVTYTANQTDLVYAKSAEYTGKDSDNDLVAFTFNHLLSLVNFTVANGSQSATGYSFEVNNIKIAGATAGTCDVTTSPVSWTQSTAGTYSISNITVNNSTASADCGTALLIIPGTVSVSFNVDIIYNDTKIGTKDYSKGNITLAAGNSYNFVVTPVVGQEIKFNVATNPTWTTNPDITIE